MGFRALQTSCGCDIKVRDASHAKKLKNSIRRRKKRKIVRLSARIHGYGVEDRPYKSAVITSLAAVRTSCAHRAMQGHHLPTKIRGIYGRPLCMYARMCSCMHVLVCVRSRMRLYACVCVCVCVFVRACVSDRKIAEDL